MSDGECRPGPGRPGAAPLQSPEGDAAGRQEHMSSIWTQWIKQHLLLTLQSVAQGVSFQICLIPRGCLIFSPQKTKSLLRSLNVRKSNNWKVTKKEPVVLVVSACDSFIGSLHWTWCFIFSSKTHLYNIYQRKTIRPKAIPKNALDISARSALKWSCIYAEDCSFCRGAASRLLTRPDTNLNWLSRLLKHKSSVSGLQTQKKKKTKNKPHQAS